MNAYIVNYNSFNQKYGIVIAANEERAWKKLLKDIQSRDEKIGEGINNLMSCWFSEVRIIKRIARFFAIFGFYSIFHFFVVSFRKEKFRIVSVNTIIFVLLAELILLGILKIYPFTGERVTLFFAPFVLLAIIRGIYLLKKINPILFVSVICTYCIFLISNAVYLLINFLQLY